MSSNFERLQKIINQAHAENFSCLSGESPLLSIYLRISYLVSPFEKSWKLLNIFITNSRMSTGSCHIAIEEIPGGKGNDFGK